MNGIVIVDKPAGWTSQDVCSKLRGALGERRVGHSGTLDPMATGVLPVFVGRATRAVGFAQSDAKRYTAALRLGIVTDTQDTSGSVLEAHPADVTEAALLAVLPEFTGEISQVPPMYSAVKIGGKKLYELARRGQIVERPARDVTISSITLLRREGEDFILDIACSKGTYIRTLCHDIGRRLGCGGAMASLRRTVAGVFTEADAHPLLDIVDAHGEGFVLPVDTLFSHLPEAHIAGEAERRCRCGNDFPAGLPDGEYRVYGESGEFLMLGGVFEGKMRTVKSFFAL